MRRVLAVALAGLAVVATAQLASAQEETPSATFSSPTRAVAGAPIWVRSVTPCPVTAGAYQFVRIGISAQSEPSIEYIESTDSDLAPDGSWTVTLSAPGDMPKGITKSYEIQAQCIQHIAPYLAPSQTATTEAETTTDTAVSYQRYFMRRLSVTGFGTSEAATSGAPTGETTTTTSTTSTTVAATVEAASLAAAATQPAGVDEPTTTWLSDEKARAAEARAELARLTKSSDDDVTLSASPVVATAPRPTPDGGVPWWSFVLATMLAVGAVVGFGQRRRSSD